MIVDLRNDSSEETKSIWRYEFSSVHFCLSVNDRSLYWYVVPLEPLCGFGHWTESRLEWDCEVSAGEVILVGLLRSCEARAAGRAVSECTGQPTSSQLLCGAGETLGDGWKRRRSCCVLRIEGAGADVIVVAREWCLQLNYQQFTTVGPSTTHYTVALPSNPNHDDPHCLNPNCC